MSDFVTRNKPQWRELEQLIVKARKHIRHMTPEELARLDVLYRQAVVQLAQVATRTDDAELQKYLNGLVAAAHGIIYLPPRKSAFAGALEFVMSGFARSVARTWRYHVVSALLLVAGGVLAYYAASSDPLAAYALSTPGDVRLPGSGSEQLHKALRSGRDQEEDEKFFFASFLFSHNIKIGLAALCLGVLGGVPTILLTLYNGMLLGSFTAMHHQAGIYGEYWAWILPHGVTELGAIVLCSGVGLLLGKSVLSPGELTRTESLRRAGREAIAVSLGVTGMLLLAAAIESFLRQSELPTEARLAFAAGTAVFWAVYFLYGAKCERDARRPSAAAELAKLGLQQG